MRILWFGRVYETKIIANNYESHNETDYEANNDNYFIFLASSNYRLLEEEKNSISTPFSYKINYF